MILVDISIRLEQSRCGTIGLDRVFYGASVACYPFIIGELACGTQENKTEILNLLKKSSGSSHHCQ